MSIELAQVEQEIEAKKAEIGETIERLGDKAAAAARKGAETLNLKHQFEQRPWWVLAGAVGLGAVLGRKTPPMRAIVVSLTKPDKDKKQKRAKQPQASHPAIEKGSQLLLSTVVPGVVGALLKRYTREGR